MHSSLTQTDAFRFFRFGFFDADSEIARAIANSILCASTFAFPTVSESPKACILFQITKASLGLDTPVHPQQDPLFAGDPLQILFPVLVEFLGNIQVLRPVFERDFAVVSFDTFFFAGTSAAVFATVNRCFSLISCLCFFPSLSY